MPSDRSRRTDLPRHGYTGVVAQQGRVILDRDFNAGQNLTAARVAADALDEIGPCGTPDDGFRIDAVVASPPHPPFWSPPEPPPAESPPFGPGGPDDFLISPGTMYLGGERVLFHGEQSNAAITYSYFDQPDWPAPPPPDAGTMVELIYLDVTEQEVSAVEDSDLLEVALGGPDTTQRLKLLRRVRRAPSGSTNCTAAWQEAVANWEADGLGFDPATMRLQPRARLQVGFTQDGGTGDPCDPVATGGYLSAENQLIRVRIAHLPSLQSPSGKSPSGRALIWGWDNASFMYRATVFGTNKLTLAGGPPDAFHAPQKDQWVEILRTAAVLGTAPDATQPDGPRIERVAADATGFLCPLARSYGQTDPGDPLGTIMLSAPLPDDIMNDTLPVFVRVWQNALPLDLTGQPVTLADAGGVSTGVTVAIATGFTDVHPAIGAFWEIAVRPETPQGVYPEDLLDAPRPPVGPRRWVCPLAVIQWSRRGAPAIVDCRNKFDNLVELTRRKQGCCTLSIGCAT